jgi:hypothetical protein
MGWSLADTAGTCIGIGALRVSTDITFAGIAITENGYGSVANGESVSRDNRRLAKFRGAARTTTPAKHGGRLLSEQLGVTGKPKPSGLDPIPSRDHGRGRRPDRSSRSRRSNRGACGGHALRSPADTDRGTMCRLAPMTPIASQLLELRQKLEFCASSLFF